MNCCGHGAGDCIFWQFKRMRTQRTAQACGFCKRVTCLRSRTPDASNHVVHISLEGRLEAVVRCVIPPNKLEATDKLGVICEQEMCPLR